MRQPPRLISPARRWARRFVWGVFVVVVVLRVLMPMTRGPMMVQQFAGGPPRFGGPEGMQRRWRPPVPVRTPVAAVPTNLWRMEIQIAARDVDALRRTSFEWRRGPRDERPEVSVTVHEGGTVYTNVTLHLKGSAGSFRAFDDKPAMTLNFTKHVPGRKFHGLSKLSLNNSVQDPSYVAEALCRELFEAGGVPVPRTTHATVVLNGRDLGLYVLAEGWGKPFLKRHFKDVDGNLYDGGFVQDIDAGLAVNSGEDGEGRVELRRLLAAAGEPNRSNRWVRLSETLDVERFAGLLALEVMTCHWDGYSLNRNNYRVFHDRTTDRLVFMPHGLDQMFGRGGRMGPGSSLEPTMRGLVARAFMSTGPGRKLYYERVRKFQSELFSAEKLTARARELAAEIQPTLAAYGPDVAADEASALDELCEGIRARVASIGEQLKAPREPAVFDARGVARPTSWVPRVNTQSRPGRAALDRVTIDGKSMLRVDAGRQGGSGSWRSRVVLAEGQYRFEGTVRTTRVGANGGVALRISGAPRRYERAREGDGFELVFRFSVEEPSTEVELVCELDAASGVALFEENSLRLVRE